MRVQKCYLPLEILKRSYDHPLKINFTYILLQCQSLLCLRVTHSGSGHPKIDERHAKIGLPFEAKGFPVEILTLSEQNGVRLRATVSEFGPVLLSRILDLSETQEGIVAVVFKYCDDNKLPLLDLKDFKKVLQYATGEGKKEYFC